MLTVTNTNGMRPLIAMLIALLGLHALGGVPLVHAQDCHFGDGSVMEDLDDDGQLTPTDLALWFKDQVDGVPMQDFDGDGTLTAEDLWSFMRQFARNMAGDLDGDGAVTVYDMSALVENAGVDGGVLVNEGDLNNDGVVDEHDFVILAERIGCPLDDETVDQVVSGILASLRFLPLSEAGYDFGTTTHVVFFSEAWNDADHALSTSLENWGPNHDPVISALWTNDPNLHDTDSSKLWPSNHFFELSELWDIADHSENGSQAWPLNHKLQRSQTWPEDHITFKSQSWPPNHIATDSVNEGQSPHETEISSFWTHGQESSEAIWPPSHHPEMSESWMNHDSVLSATWPPSHINLASSSWPGDEDWPSNHFEVDSKKWKDPNSIPFPPGDHSEWDTNKDLINIIDIILSEEQESLP